MEFSKIKSFLRNNIYLFPILKFIIDNYLIFLRLKDVLMMMLLFLIKPEYVYKYSTRKLLPPQKKKKMVSEQDVLPFEIYIKKSSKIKKIQEANFVGTGKSFNLNYLKKANIPTFLVSFWDTIKIDENDNLVYNPPNNHYSYTYNKKQNNLGKLKEFYNDNIIYVHNRELIIKKFSELGHKVLAVQTFTKKIGQTPKQENKVLQKESYKKLLKKYKIDLISVIDKNYKNFPNDKFSDWAPCGSLIPCLSAINYISEKINIYGWDFYLDKSPEKINFMQLLLKMYNYKLDLKRSRNHFESALFNFYYGYKCSHLPQFKNYGNTGKLQNHKSLIKKIEKVIFN